MAKDERFSEETTEMSLGYESLLPGKYKLQVEEGISLLDSRDPDSQAKRIMIPMTAIETKDDDCKECIGRKMALFQNVVKANGEPNEIGEAIIGRFISICGGAKYFSSKLAGVSMSEDQFIVEMNKTLPGRLVVGMVKMGKDMNGNDRAEYGGFKAVAKQREFKASGGTQQEVVQEDDGDDDSWG